MQLSRSRAVFAVCFSLCGAGFLNAADNAYVAPRGPGGVNPDLNGVWQALNEANYDLERHLARPSVSLRDGPYGPLPDLATVRLGAVASVPPSLGVVEDGTIPYKPEALAVRDENRRHWIERDPEIKCFLPGVPRATYLPQPFQILQGDKEIEIVYQFAGAVRNVYSESPGPAPVDSWMGQSVSSWDGDTLVLTVTGLIDQTWLDRAGNHHSNQMTVVERYTPTGPNHLHYEATIEGSLNVHGTVEDQHAAVSPHGAGRHDFGFQVRRLRGRVDVRQVATQSVAAMGGGRS